MMDKVPISHLVSDRRVEMRPGIHRVTMSYNDQSMLCYFYMKKGSRIELHNHEAVQNGFIVKGRARFFDAAGSDHVFGPGDGYVFDSNEQHGAEFLEDTELIECFSPMRPEYAV